MNIIIHIYIYIISEPPKIPPGISGNQSIIHNDRVTMLCPAQGIPKPYVTWYKDGQPITGNEIGLRLLPDGALQIDQAEPQHAGRYKCLASNIAGNASHLIDLKILSKNIFLPPSEPGVIFSVCLTFR